MPTIQVEAEVSAEKLLEAARQLSQAELQEFVIQVLALQAQRKAPVLTREESSLFVKINGAPPQEIRQRYRELIKRRREENLSESEHAELLRLTEIAEKYQVERLEALIELSHIRGTSLDELMDSLGIVPPPVE